MSNLQTKLEAIKNKEVAASVSKQHNYTEGDVLKIAGVRQVKGGKEKVILTNRLFVVTGDSKKGDMIRGILIDNNSNLQNCVITLPTNVMTKVGKYTEDGEVIEDISEVVESSDTTE